MQRITTVIILVGIVFFILDLTNKTEGCCPRAMGSRRQAEPEDQGPQDDGAEAKREREEKKKEKESSGEQKKKDDKKDDKKDSSGGEQKSNPSGGSLGSGSFPSGTEDASGAGSPAPRVRPPLGPGIQPLIQSIKSGGASLLGVADPWEAWWTRNREYYLNVHQPIEWVKTISEGETKSVKRFAEYDKLIAILGDVLGNKNPYVAFRAAISLGMVNDESATNILKKAYGTEKRFFIRNNIIFALGLTGDSTTPREVLADKSEAILSRCYAAAAMSYANDSATVKLLGETISHKDDGELISCAALSLGNSGDTSAIPLLANLIHPAKEQEMRKDARVRIHALLALARIGKGDLSTADRKTVLSEICKAAADPDRDVRAAVAVALSTIKANEKEAKDTLLSLLKDTNALTRGLAAISLAQTQTGTKDVYDLISQVFPKSGEEDRGLVLLAFGFSGDAKATLKLREILQGRKDKMSTKGAAAIALGIIKDKETVPILLDYLKKQDDPVFTPYAILALGMIGDERAIEPLSKKWEEFDKGNSSAMGYTNLAVALTMLGKKDELVIPHLIKHCGADQIETLRVYAFHTLGILGSRENAQLFIDAYNNQKPSAELYKSIVTGIGFLLDKNTMPVINRFTANSFDTYMIIMDHILPIPVW